MQASRGRAKRRGCRARHRPVRGGAPGRVVRGRLARAEGGRSQAAHPPRRRLRSARRRWRRAAQRSVKGQGGRCLTAVLLSAPIAEHSAERRYGRFRWDSNKGTGRAARRIAGGVATRGRRAAIARAPLAPPRSAGGLRRSPPARPRRGTAPTRGAPRPQPRGRPGLSSLARSPPPAGGRCHSETRSSALGRGCRCRLGERGGARPSPLPGTSAPAPARPPSRPADPPRGGARRPRRRGPSCSNPAPPVQTPPRRRRSTSSPCPPPPPSSPRGRAAWPGRAGCGRGLSRARRRGPRA